MRDTINQALISISNEIWDYLLLTRNLLGVLELKRESRSSKDSRELKLNKQVFEKICHTRIAEKYATVKVPKI